MAHRGVAIAGGLVLLGAGSCAWAQDTASQVGSELSNSPVPAASAPHRHHHHASSSVEAARPATLPPSGALTSGGAIGSSGAPSSGGQPAPGAVTPPVSSGGATGTTTITGGPPG